MGLLPGDVRAASAKQAHARDTLPHFLTEFAGIGQAAFTDYIAAQSSSP